MGLEDSKWQGWGCGLCASLNGVKSNMWAEILTKCNGQREVILNMIFRAER